jgi:hypothetical protein
MNSFLPSKGANLGADTDLDHVEEQTHVPDTHAPSSEGLSSKHARGDPLRLLKNLAEVGGIPVPAFLSNLRNTEIKAAQKLFRFLQPQPSQVVYRGHSRFLFEKMTKMGSAYMH